MKLQQLRHIQTVAQEGINISAAAKRLYTPEPDVSKQIRLLEEELGVDIFARRGKHLTEITPVGKVIIDLAKDLLHRVEGIKQAAREFQDETSGSLRIATTHTQAQYALPHAITTFIERYPKVSLQLHQTSPAQIAELAVRGEVDFAITTEGLEWHSDLVVMPCYSWNRMIIVPLEHPLAETSELRLADLATYPLVTYMFGFAGRAKFDEAFQREGLEPQVVFTATNADVIKTYVRLGLGVGIIAGMAYDPEEDRGLVALDARHLFPPNTTMIGCRRGTFLRGYMYDFIELFAPHLGRELVDKLFAVEQRALTEALLADIEVPVR